MSDLSGSTAFFSHYLTKNMTCIELEMGVWIFFTNLSETFLILRRTEICHKCTNIFKQSTRYSCKILMKLGFSRRIFGISSNIKFHEDPSSGSRVVPCRRTYGQTDKTDEQRHMTKLTVAIPNFCQRA